MDNNYGAVITEQGDLGLGVFAINETSEIKKSDKDKKKDSDSKK